MCCAAAVRWYISLFVSKMTFLVENGVGPVLCKSTCRLCIQEDQTLWNIFETCDSDGRSLQLAQKIIACLDILVEINDGLPDLICAKCMTVVRCFYDFRQQCKANDSILKANIISTEPQGDEIIIPDTLSFCSSRKHGNFIERDSSPPCKAVTVCDISESQHSILNNDNVHEGLTSQETPLVQQLEDEWSEDDCAEVEGLTQNVKQSELPWRQFEEVPTESKDVKPSVIAVETTVNHMHIQECGNAEVCDNNGNRYYDLSEDCNEDPLANTEGQENKIEVLAVYISSGCLDELNNAHSESELEYVRTTDIGNSQEEGITQSSNNKENLMVEDSPENNCGNEINFSSQVELYTNEEDVSSRKLEERQNSCKLECSEGKSDELFAGRVKRSKLKKWICNICEKEFATVRKWQCHVLTHYSKLFQCPECRANFDSSEELTIHQAKHTSVFVLGHSCLQCVKSFRLKHLLDKHIAVEHTSTSTSKNIPKKFRESCGKCIRIFYSSQEMENHYESCGEDANESEKKPPPVVYSKEEPLIKRTEGRWECPLCKLRFTSNAKFTRHSQNVHNIEPRFKCEYFACEKEFSTNCKLKDHIIKVHKRIFECKICGKKYKQSVSLKAHLRNHTGEKPFKCNKPNCKAAFASTNGLYNHKKYHLKPFKCAKCGQHFGSVSNLRRHEIRHDSEPHFICDVCGVRFFNEQWLKDHRANHSNVV